MAGRRAAAARLARTYTAGTNSRLRRAALLLCAACLCAGAVVLGLRVLHDSPGTPAVAMPMPAIVHPPPGPDPVSSPDPADATAIAEVRELISEEYYREVPPEILALASIPSIVAALADPHTEYLPPDSYSRLEERLTHRYFGVGLTVAQAEGGLQVTSSGGGPAHQAGIRPGDLIVSVDGQRARHLNRATELIRGEPGTVVQLRVRRPGLNKPMEFRVVRSAVELPSLEARLLRAQGHRLAYIRIFSFSEGVSTRAAHALTSLRKRGAEAVLLDLRGDPGGLLIEAIRLTSLFVEKGVVCSVEGEHEPRVEHYALGNAIETEHPVAVLVDGASASAAEIVTAALHDHGRATVVGERTYGKATVQALFPLSNGAVLRLTTAEYVTPAGARIGGSGIEPDVEAPDDAASVPDEAVATAKQVLVEGL